MVNKDMNGFPVKKCSAFQFFKKRVRRWIKNPMVSVDKHQSPSLKYTGPSVVHIPPGEPDFEPSLCQTCLGDHAFQRGVLPQEKESCSWETQSACEVSSKILGLCFSCIHAIICPQKTFWHIYEASEEDRELWPLSAHFINFFYYYFQSVFILFLFFNLFRHIMGIQILRFQ
uniref:Serum/glucocorticoid regulated kinase 1 n=1 Tax=Microcebus murinus TaxID=30608 RepID=A0A8C5XK56_MICMU